MPHTNPWSDVDPPGSQAANTIDDELRQLRLDIHERMDDIVVDWEADPVVLAPGAAGIVTTGVGYDDTLSDSNKVFDTAQIAAILAIKYHGIANGAGVIVINLDEVNALTGTDWQAANLYLPFGSVGNILPISFVGRRDDDTPVLVEAGFVDTFANTITLETNAVDISGAEPVRAWMQFAFTVAP